MAHSSTNFGGTAIYVDDVPAALDFYRRAFGLRTRFFDEALQYGELEGTILGLSTPVPANEPVPAAEGHTPG